jgi:hypothetical protein
MQIEIVVRKRRVPLSDWYSGEWSGRAGWADGPKTPDCYRTGEPIADLLDARWRLANLGPDEERELIRRAQAGDKRAANELHRRFHKTILKIAKETRFAALDWADRIAVGHRALWLAISRFNLGRNEPVRLASYAKRCIVGVLLDEVKATARFGMKWVPKNTWVKLADYNEALAEASWDEGEPCLLGIRDSAQITSWRVVRLISEAEHADAGAIVGRGKDDTLAPLLGRFEREDVRGEIERHSELSVAVPPPCGRLLGRRGHIVARHRVSHNGAASKILASCRKTPGPGLGTTRFWRTSHARQSPYHESSVPVPRPAYARRSLVMPAHGLRTSLARSGP